MTLEEVTVTAKRAFTCWSEGTLDIVRSKDTIVERLFLEGKEVTVVREVARLPVVLISEEEDVLVESIDRFFAEPFIIQAPKGKFVVGSQQGDTILPSLTLGTSTTSFKGSKKNRETTVEQTLNCAEVSSFIGLSGIVQAGA